MANFSILPSPLIVGEDVSQDDFFNHMLSLPPSFEGRIALDTETTGLSITRDLPVFASMSDGKDRWLLHVDDLFHPAMSELLSDPDRVWVFANAKYDMHMLSNLGLPEITGEVMDVVVMCLLRDENRKGGAGLGLKEQSNDYLGIKMKSFKDVFKINTKEIGTALLDAPLDKVAGYATLDAYCTWLLSEEHMIELQMYEMLSNPQGYKTLWDYYEDLEMPFTKTLWRMERRGMRVDCDHLRKLAKPMGERVEKLLQEIYKEAKRPLNPNSPKQLQEVLFGPKNKGGLALKPLKETKTGPSTDKMTLERYAPKVPLCAKVLEYRALTKLLGTYINKMPREVSRQSRIHTNLKQHGTVTGRLASSDPNLQNIPSKGKIGTEIRKSFVAGPGYTLVVADYSQMEMCIMAHMSGDENMIGAISDGLDLHSFTASNMLGVEYDHVITAKVLSDLEEGEDPISKVSKKLGIKSKDAEILVDDVGSPDYQADLLSARSAAKAIGFGLMYGRGPTALGQEIGVNYREAKQKINDWFDTFPAVRSYITNLTDFVRTDERHTAYTILGRPRRLHNITSSNSGVRAKAERDLVNSPIQGSASCITKLAMVLLDKDPLIGGDCLEGGSEGVRMLMQVHDELIFEVRDNLGEEKTQWIVNRIKEIMCNAVILDVPLTTSGGTALSWGEAK